MDDIINIYAGSKLEQQHQQGVVFQLLNNEPQ